MVSQRASLRKASKNIYSLDNGGSGKWIFSVWEENFKQGIALGFKQDKKEVCVISAGRYSKTREKFGRC